MRRSHIAVATLAILGILGCASKEKTGMKIYVQQKLYDKAIHQGMQALQQNPQDGDTHYFMGAAYFGKDQDLSPDAPGYADSAEVFLSKAYHHFTEATKYAEAKWGQSADDNIRSMYGRHYNRGVIASKKNDHATAALEFRLATIADPQNFEGYYAAASALWQLALEAQKRGEDEEFENLTQAILKNLDKVLELGTDDKETTIAVYQTKGEVLYKRGDLEGAQQAYERAIQLSPENYSLMLTVAERFYNESDWENAVGYFQDAMSVKERLGVVDDSDADNYAALANALSKLGRRLEAIETYKKILEMRPDDTATLYNMMVTHYKAGEQAEKDGDTALAKQHYSQAIQLGDKLIGLEPSRPEYWQVRGLSKRGIADFAGAARDLKKYKDLRASGGGR